MLNVYAQPPATGWQDEWKVPTAAALHQRGAVATAPAHGARGHHSLRTSLTFVTQELTRDFLSSLLPPPACAISTV